MIQQVVGAAEMGEVNRMIEDDGPEVSTQAPGGSHANIPPSPLSGAANVEASVEHPREQPQTGLRSVNVL